jgi:hypothetical protein
LATSLVWLASAIWRSTTLCSDSATEKSFVVAVDVDVDVSLTVAVAAAVSVTVVAVAVAWVS